MNLQTICITVDTDIEPDSFVELVQMLQEAGVHFGWRERAADLHEQADYIAEYGEEDE